MLPFLLSFDFCLNNYLKKNSLLDLLGISASVCQKVKFHMWTHLGLSLWDVIRVFIVWLCCNERCCVANY